MNKERTSFRAARRPLSEQLVGLGISFSCSLAFFILCRWLIHFSPSLPPYLQFYSENRVLENWMMVGFFSPNLILWILWKTHPIVELKLELIFSLFISLLMIGWTFSFFVIQQPFLALISILLAGFTLILLGILLWKKKGVLTLLLALSFLWVCYLGGYSMVICSRL